MNTMNIGRYQFYYKKTAQYMYIERVEPNGCICYYRYFHTISKETREYLPTRGIQDFERAWQKVRLQKIEVVERG